MKERPILFSGPMVRAIREGWKTQTRRVVKTQPYPDGEARMMPDGSVAFTAGPVYGVKCPFGEPGDRLWVRETWGLHAHGDMTDWAARGDDITLERWEVQYRADWGPAQEGCFWRPSIHMPRWASRITLEIVSVRVERLQDISDEDAIAEGCESLREDWSAKCGDFDETLTNRDLFETLWESINGTRSWGANPWVWVVEFKEVTR